MAGERAPGSYSQGNNGAEFGERERTSPAAELWKVLGRPGGDPGFFAAVDAICGPEIETQLAGHKQLRGDEAAQSLEGLNMMTDFYLARYQEQHA